MSEIKKIGIYFLLLGLVLIFIISVLIIFKRISLKDVNSIEMILTENNIAPNAFVVNVGKNENHSKNREDKYEFVVIKEKDGVSATKSIQSLIEIADFFKKESGLFEYSHIIFSWNSHYNRKGVQPNLPEDAEIFVNTNADYQSLEILVDGVEMDKLDLTGFDELGFVLSGVKISYSERIAKIRVRVAENGDVNALSNFPNLKEIKFVSIIDNEEFIDSLISITNNSKHLRKIIFFRDRISSESLSTLKRALPYCEIYEADYDEIYG